MSPASAGPSPSSFSNRALPAGGANDAAAGEPQVPVPFQEEVHHPQREKEADQRLCSALPLPHTHQRKRSLHQVTAEPLFLFRALMWPLLTLDSPSQDHPDRNGLQQPQLGVLLHSQGSFFIQICFSFSKICFGFFSFVKSCQDCG